MKDLTLTRMRERERERVDVSWWTAKLRKQYLDYIGDSRGVDMGPSLEAEEAEKVMDLDLSLREPPRIREPQGLTRGKTYES